MGDRAAAVAAVQQFITDNPNEALTIKQELDAVLPGQQVLQPPPDNGANLARIMETLSISRSAKLRKFEKNDNFARFCERFSEYCELTNMDPANQYTFFLQNVDDKTYSILKSVTISDDQKRHKDQFCALFKRAIYGDESLALKNELRDCKQKSDEKVSDYVYRLREKARIAYPDQEEADENCLLAFIRGVRDSHIRRKLNEATIVTFRDATKLAKRLEKVNTMFEKEQSEYTQVLSNQKVVFDESNSEDPASNQYGPRDNPGSAEKSKNSRNFRDRSRSRSRSRDRYYPNQSRQRDYSGNGYNQPRGRSRDNSRDRYEPRSSRSATPFPRDRTRDRYRSQSRDRQSHDRYRSRSRERQSRNRYRSQSRNRNTRDSRSSSRDRRYDRYSSRESSRTPDRGVTCYACGKLGHYAPDCPITRGADKGVTCYACKKRGHYARDCPNIRYYVDKDRVYCGNKPSSSSTTGTMVEENDKNFQ